MADYKLTSIVSTLYIIKIADDTITYS